MFVYKISLLLLLVMFAFTALAQEELPTQSVFVELGGPALVYSFNYDFRFDKENIASWGMRIGAGGYARNRTFFSGYDKTGLFTLPVQVTRLFGKRKHFFEVGGGATFIYYRQTSNYNNLTSLTNKNFGFILDTGDTPNFMGTLNFGYRKIPENGGFTFRANLSPVFNKNGFWPLYAGIGFGYAF